MILKREYSILLNDNAVKKVSCFDKSSASKSLKGLREILFFKVKGHQIETLKK